MTPPLGDPYLPTEPEWLILAQAGIKKTSELPRIIPPLPEGDTKDLKVWRDYWVQHDARIRQDEREKVLDETLKKLISLTSQTSPTQSRFVWLPVIETVIAELRSGKQGES